MDFDTKQCTEVAIPYNHNTTSSHISNIRVSEMGKYYLVDLGVPTFDSLDGFNFFNNENKYLFTESPKHINNQNPNQNISFSFENPVFISDEYMAAVVREWSNLDNSELNSYIGLFRITDRKTIKLVKFDRDWHLCYNATDVAITNYSGTIILLNIDALPVQENKINPIEKTAEYQNGILTINSEIAEKADIEIIDYLGNMIYTKKDILLQAGKNLLNIDYPFTNGVYFAIVKSTQKELSYKFIVAR
jgi:low affinity Fe/Cu permease